MSRHAPRRGRHVKAQRARPIPWPVAIGLISGAVIVTGAGNALAEGPSTSDPVDPPSGRGSATEADDHDHLERGHGSADQRAPRSPRTSTPTVSDSDPMVLNVKVEDRRSYTIFRTSEGDHRVRNYEPKGLVNVPGNQVGSPRSRAERAPAEPEKATAPLEKVTRPMDLLGTVPTDPSVQTSADAVPCEVGVEVVDAVVDLGAPVPLGYCGGWIV